MIQKLQRIAFDLEEEEGLNISVVAGRVQGSLDVDRLTKSFYDRFKKEHDVFLEFVEGILAVADCEWYASLMLNRLMFLYFIQKKGFLDGDLDYLRNRLEKTRQTAGKDKFQRFYRLFLLRLFHEGLDQAVTDRPPDLAELLGNIPYLNGGLFEVHDLETNNPDIHIPDEAFEKLFDFFDGYAWHLDERPLRADNEINPDVLGYIFEKYINQKELGAYYTKEDITGYISRNSIIPSLFNSAQKKCPIAFRPDGGVWRLIQEEPDRYVYAEIKKGVDLNLPLEIAAGIDNVSLREGWNRPAPEEYALPTETWRDVVNRRKHYEELFLKLADGEVRDIREIITLNLDICRFTEDAIIQSEGPELVNAFWGSLEDVSVLDPACGSGAFLFAALNVLEPLYTACLEAMRGFLDDLEESVDQHQPDVHKPFPDVLEQLAEHHPNQRYFVLKSIVINNLYGVDIVEEAAEICKLRLFLKLVAQLETYEEIEPLPDIDFNIRTGNTLVGFTSLDVLRNAMQVTPTGQSRMLSSEDLESLAQIEKDAEIGDRAYQKFREMQTLHSIDSGKFVEAKVDLRRRLDGLRNELDLYLANESGVETHDADLYREWHSSHQPFHWLVEFYGIIKGGGFDVVIGNPPYLALRALKKYTVTGYETVVTRNLYAIMLERCQALVSEHGHQGYIVPVSSIATEGYLTLQQIMTRRRLVISSFDDRPAHLFDGLDKNTLSILLASEHSEAPNVASTRLCRWSAEEREALFPLLQYHPTPSSQLEGCLPKIGSSVEASIWEKLFSTDKPLSSFYDRQSGHVTYYSRKVNAFLQILDFIPEVRDGKGRLRPPSEFKELAFSTEAQAAAVFCHLNSTLFRWFMDTASDGSHLNRRELDNFPFDPMRATSEYPNFVELGNRLSERLQETSISRVMRYQHDTLTVQCIIPKHSKTLLDEIDTVLARHYGFTEEELDFIINYDIKYRLGQD